MGAEPELVRAVYVQLSATDRVEVARAMIKQLTDEEMRALVWTEDGRRLLYEINRWVANDSLTGDGRAHAVEDGKLRERIGVALTRRDDIQEIITQQLPNVQAERRQSDMFPPRYTAEDVRRLFGRDAYTRLDDWVNIVARGEGSFTQAGDVRGDDDGLSVGIKQWTLYSGNLGRLMQRYRDVAEREGKLNEFYEVFGGRESAERMLQILRDNPRSVRPDTIQSMFAEAGGRAIFQRAQIELAREEVSRDLRQVMQNHPYLRDGQLSAQSVATSLIVNNIGPARLGRVHKQTINELYAELLRQNATVRKQVQGRAVTDALKREIVVANIAEQEFNDRLVRVAPRVLYTSLRNYRTNARGLENRLRHAISLYSPDEHVRADGQ